MNLPRRVPRVPFRMSPMHFETTKTLQEIDEAITDVLLFGNIAYSAPKAIATYFINDKDINAEIHIYVGEEDDTFVVEAKRMGGDGFKVLAILNRIIARLEPEEALEEIKEEDNQDLEYDFNGMPLDDTSCFVIY